MKKSEVLQPGGNITTVQVVIHIVGCFHHLTTTQPILLSASSILDFNNDCARQMTENSAMLCDWQTTYKK